MLGYDPMSEVGGQQRVNLAAALQTACTLAPDGVRRALWIDAAQVALLWLREPTPENADPCREMLAKVRTEAPSLAEDSDESALASATLWTLEMIAGTRFGPAQTGAAASALRVVLNDAAYLAAVGGSDVAMRAGAERALATFVVYGGNADAAREALEL